MTGLSQADRAPGGAGMPELIDLALNVARNKNWPVFPCAEDKRPAIPKREGGNGFRDASTAPAAIVRMFRHPSAALIGIPTGEASGFDALDVDVKHDAARAWLIAAKDRLPATRVYRTRSGGFHVLFRHAPGVRNTESHVARGVDTRGEGGYIVFWFAAGHDCTDHSAIAEWPGWLLASLSYQPKPDPPPSRARAYRSNGGSADNLIAATVRKVESAPEGSRHATLRAAARTLGGVMGAAGLDNGTASRLLLDAVLRAGGTRIDQRNALGTIAWGLERGAASPLAVGGR